MRPLTKRILVTTCLGAGLLVVACSGTSETFNTAGKGQLMLTMTTGSGPTINAVGTTGFSSTGAGTGAPGVTTNDMGEGPSLSSFKSANVTFSKIQAQNTGGTWVDVLIALPVTVDVVAIRDGKNFSLPAGFLPPGTYDRLKVTITQVDIVLMDGTNIAITPPAGGWTVEVATRPFTIVEGQTTSIHLKFREDMSFHFLGGTIGFNPDIEDED